MQVLTEENDFGLAFPEQPSIKKGTYNFMGNCLC